MNATMPRSLLERLEGPEIDLELIRRARASRRPGDRRAPARTAPRGLERPRDRRSVRS